MVCYNEISAKKLKLKNVKINQKINEENWKPSKVQRSK